MKQLVCRDCGWKSELYPDGTVFMGFGGQIGCPDCTKAQRNSNIEVYGNVDDVDVPPFKGWKMSRSHRTKLIHYYENDKALCGSQAEADEYLIKKHYEHGYSKKFLEQLGKMFCPKCESSVANEKKEEI
jgi:hypothetical protein